MGRHCESDIGKSDFYWKPFFSIAFGNRMQRRNPMLYLLALATVVVSAGSAEVQQPQCEVTGWEGTYMDVDVDTGDESYVLTILRVRCWQTEVVDGKTVETPHALYIGSCPDGSWDQDAQVCIQCPKELEAELKVKLKGDVQHLQCEPTGNKMCRCSYILVTKKNDGGEFRAHKIQDVSALIVAKAIVVKPLDTWMEIQNRIIPPAFECPGMAFSKMPLGIKQVMVMPPIAKDSIAKWLGLLTYVVPNRKTISEEITKEHVKGQVTMLIMQSIDKLGMVRKVGPTAQDFTSGKCTLATNLWVDASNELEIDVTPKEGGPVCDAGAFQPLKEIMKKQQENILAAVDSNVTCNGPGPPGPLGMHDRRLSARRTRAHESYKRDQQFFDTVLGARLGSQSGRSPKRKARPVPIDPIPGRVLTGRKMSPKRKARPVSSNPTSARMLNGESDVDETDGNEFGSASDMGGDVGDDGYYVGDAGDAGDDGYYVGDVGETDGNEFGSASDMGGDVGDDSYYEGDAGDAGDDGYYVGDVGDDGYYEGDSLHFQNGNNFDGDQDLDPETMDWTMYDGMPCNVKDKIIEIKMEDVIQSVFLLSVTDVWIGCGRLLNSWITFETQTQVRNTDNCVESMYADDGGVNNKWTEDPCCNPDRRKIQCCAPREVTSYFRVISDVNTVAMAEYEVGSNNNGLAAQIAYSYDSIEKVRAQTCFEPYREFLKSISGDVWDQVITCFDEVQVTWNNAQNQYLGKKCNADSDCWTLKCNALPKKDDSGKSKDKFCANPADLKNGDYVVPVARCLIGSASNDIRDNFIYSMRQKAGSEVQKEDDDAEVVAKGILSESSQENFCYGQTMSSHLINNQADCLAEQGCNWGFTKRTKEDCLNPCTNARKCEYFCSKGQWDTSKQPICKLRGTDADLCMPEQEIPKKMGKEYFETLEKEYKSCWEKMCTDKGAIFFQSAEFDDCINPELSFDNSPEAQQNCESECMADEGLRIKPKKGCYVRLNPKYATDDTCNELSGDDFISPIYVGGKHKEDIDDSNFVGSTVPLYCKIESLRISESTHRTIQTELGPDCVDSCKKEFKACLQPDQCLEELDHGTTVRDKCSDGFPQYNEKFDACYSSCIGLACGQECLVSIGLAHDQTFNELNCNSCTGKWLSIEERAIACAAELDDPCRFEKTSPRTSSQPCSPPCLFDLCGSLFDGCVNEKRDATACAKEVNSLNQCRSCTFRCDDDCSQECSEFEESWIPKKYCNSCDSTDWAKCDPASSCYDDPSCWAHRRMEEKPSDLNQQASTRGRIKLRRLDTEAFDPPADPLDLNCQEDSCEEQEAMCNQFFAQLDPSVSKGIAKHGYGEFPWVDVGTMCSKVVDNICYMSKPDAEELVADSGIEVPERGDVCGKLGLYKDDTYFHGDAGMFDGKGACYSKIETVGANRFFSHVVKGGECEYDNMAVYKPKYQFIPGDANTQESCTAKRCLDHPWITTESECVSLKQCWGDSCQYCRDQGNLKEICQFRAVTSDSLTGDALSEENCKSACGTFSATCYYKQNPITKTGLCITDPPANTKLQDPMSKRCKNQKKSLTGAAEGQIKQVRYTLLKCKDLKKNDCSWAAKFDILDCGLVDEPCDNKVDCLKTGHCVYGSNYWGNADGLCVYPYSDDGGCGSGMKQEWGCIGVAQDEASCRNAHEGKWLPSMKSSVRCTAPGYVWEKDDVGFVGAGTHACCLFWLGQGQDFMCFDWSRDTPNAPECELCGGTWSSVFHWYFTGHWVEGSWVSPWEWKKREIVSANKWVTRVNAEDVAELWTRSLLEFRALPTANFIECRLGPTLEHLYGISTGHLSKIGLGSVEMLPCQSAVRVLGEVQFEVEGCAVAENKITANFANDPLAVTETRRLSAHATNKTLRGYLGGRVLAAQGAKSLTASCHSLVMHAGKTVGQLIGSCVTMDTSKPFVSDVRICIRPDPDIPRNAEFTEETISQKNGQEYSVFPAPVSKEGFKICVNVINSGTYCPAIRFADYQSSAVVSADSSCEPVAEVQNAVAAKKDELKASGFTGDNIFVSNTGDAAANEKKGALEDVALEEKEARAQTEDMSLKEEEDVAVKLGFMVPSALLGFQISWQV